MNEFINLICSRRSTKNYKSQMPSAEDIKTVATAGTYAATGRGLQSPIILAVTNKTLRDRLSKINAAVMGAQGDPFYGAPCVLVVLADKAVNTHVYDGSLVMGNMMLAATALGLGSCWIHRAKETFEGEEGKQILKELGICGDYEGIGNLVLGYANAAPTPSKPRKENYIYYID